jgi:repressor LexA
VTNFDETTYSDLASAEAQQALLIAIFKFFIKKRKPPTYRELAAERGRTPSTIHRAADELRHKGYIDEDPVGSRAGPRDITLTDRAVRWLRFKGYDVTDYLQTAMIKAHVTAVPVLGEIAAGNPIFAEEDARSYLTLPAEHLPIGKIFILDVVGDSMTGDGVLDGDQVLVVPYEQPKAEGEMVAALIDDAATIKRLWRDGDGYRLEPSNPDFTPIPIRATDKFLIQGRVVGLLRWNIR